MTPRHNERGSPQRVRSRLRALAFALPLAGIGVGGCGGGSVVAIETCTLDLALAPASAAPGVAVTATGGPLTERRDTVVLVGGVQAAVSEVSRDANCNLPEVGCDACRARADCAPCGFCAGFTLPDADRLACFGDPLTDPPVLGTCDLCVETLTFVVPEGLAPGLHPVIVFNANGQSSALALEVLAVPPGTDTDTGTGKDTGSPPTKTPPPTGTPTGDTGTP